MTERIQELLDSAVALPLEEAAPLLRYTPASLRIACRLKRIAGIKVGGRWMIPTAVIKEIAGTRLEPVVSDSDSDF